MSLKKEFNEESTLDGIKEYLKSGVGSDIILSAGIGLAAASAVSIPAAFSMPLLGMSGVGVAGGIFASAIAIPLSAIEAKDKKEKLFYDTVLSQRSRRGAMATMLAVGVLSLSGAFLAASVGEKALVNYDSQKISHMTTEEIKNAQNGVSGSAEAINTINSMNAVNTVNTMRILSR